MPLSIDKLIHLFEKKEFIVRKFFVIGENCKFIEIMSINNINSYYIHIPSEYNFGVRSSDKHNTYRIKAIPIVKPDNMEDKYAGKLNANVIAQRYDEIELKSQYPYQLKECEDIDMENNMIEQYKRPIVLKDVDEEDNKTLQCIFRQLKRLRFCVQFLKYKFCIIYKSYFCVLHSNDTIECFKVKNYVENNYRDLYITIDLEVFYENNKILMDDLQELESGIRGVLDKNQHVQSKHLQIMINKQQEIISILDILHNLKLRYRTELQKFIILFKQIDKSIKIFMENINEHNVNIPKTSGRQQDKLIQEKQKIFTRLAALYDKKEEVAKIIIHFRRQDSNLSLNIDRIMFDNNVMIDKIFKNLNQLNHLVK